jgi:hypothetical protein
VPCRMQDEVLYHKALIKNIFFKSI